MPGKSIAQQTEDAQLAEAIEENGQGLTSQYHAGFNARAHDYALLGATNAEIGELLGVSERAVDKWVVEKPKFAKAIRSARIDANVRVVKAQYHAAIGYSHRETKVFNVEGELQTIEVTKHYPPNTNAATLLLTNRDPKRWKDRKVVDSAGTVDLVELVKAVVARRDGEDAKVIEGQATETKDT